MHFQWFQQGKVKDQAGGIRKNLVASEAWKRAITEGMKKVNKKKDGDRFKNVVKEATSAAEKGEMSHSETGNWPKSDAVIVRKRKTSPGAVIVEPAAKSSKKK